MTFLTYKSGSRTLFSCRPLRGCHHTAALLSAVSLPLLAVISAPSFGRSIDREWFAARRRLLAASHEFPLISTGLQLATHDTWPTTVHLNAWRKLRHIASHKLWGHIII